MHASLSSVSLSFFLTLTLALDSAACISIRISSPLFPFYLLYPSGLSSFFVRSCSFLDRPSPSPLPSPSIPSIILARVKLLLLHPPFVLLVESPYLWRPPTHPFFCSLICVATGKLHILFSLRIRPAVRIHRRSLLGFDLVVLASLSIFGRSGYFGKSPITQPARNRKQFGSRCAATNKRTTLFAWHCVNPASKGPPSASTPSLDPSCALVLPTPTVSRLCSKTKVEVIETPTLRPSCFVGQFLLGTILDSPDFGPLFL